MSTDRSGHVTPVNHQPQWSGLARIVAGVVIIGYLAILLLGPLTNPVGAPHLTGPMARAVAPVQQALFMGHGYRFFAPDPGPNHSVHFQIETAGEPVEGSFPDRDTHWPRLLYHRWFMLSESLFRDGAVVPSDQDRSATELEYQQRIEQYRQQGKFKLRQQLIREREWEQQLLGAAEQRRDLLIRSIASTLLDRYDGQAITLSVQERLLPTAEEVASGMPLTSPGLLRRVEVGTFTREQLESDQPLFDEGLEDIQPRVRSEELP